MASSADIRKSIDAAQNCREWVLRGGGPCGRPLCHNLRTSYGPTRAPARGASTNIYVFNAFRSDEARYWPQVAARNLIASLAVTVAKAGIAAARQLKPPKTR